MFIAEVVYDAADRCLFVRMLNVLAAGETVQVHCGLKTLGCFAPIVWKKIIVWLPE